MQKLDVPAPELKALQNIFQRLASIREVQIFGSRTNGGAHRASDIDFAIDAPYATISEWSELCEALEEAPIIYEMDVLRKDQLQNPRLLERIERDGIRVYP